MKKRNYKIISIALALSINSTFAINPFMTSTYADTISETQSQNINMNVEGKTNENVVTNTFTLTNKGTAIDLSKVKLRYYFTSDNTSGQAFNCYYSAVSGLNGKHVNITDSVHGNFVKLDTPVENADSYLEISFDEKAGNFNSSETLTLNTAINNNGWSKINSDNDYSFNNASKTVVLVDDEVVYGTSPIENKEELPKVTIGGGTVNGGETIRVPVNISNVKKKGVSKFHIKVSYDPNIFEVNGYLRENSEIYNLGYKVRTGKEIDTAEHTIDIGYDFTKSEDTKALYTEGDYVTIPLDALPNVEDGTSYLKIVSEPVLTDAEGKEYLGDSITIDNTPITLKYNTDAIKDSSISENYLTFDESNLKDTDITMKKYENTVTSVDYYLAEDFKPSTLTLDTDYTISNDILTLKESFLKTLLNKNSYVTINFDKGMSQTIFINNADLNTVSDPLQSTPNNDEANISFAASYDSSFKEKTPLTFVITNTSDIDMNLSNLCLTYYYNKQNYFITDMFKLDYCSILGSNKDIRRFTSSDCSPSYYGGYSDICDVEYSFKDNNSILKPGETLVLRGSFSAFQSQDTLRTTRQEPVVTYNNETLYGPIPWEYVKDSKILSDDIVLDSDEREDISLELKLNKNTFKSIDAYCEGDFAKTLEKGTDYLFTKRNEVILTKSYLDSIDKKVTLDFKFSGGNHALINMQPSKSETNISEGALTIKNTASTAYDKGGSGSPYLKYWENLVVPVTLNDSLDEKITSSCIILKFDKNLFDEVLVTDSKHLAQLGMGDSSYASVNYDLGIIKIDPAKIKENTSNKPNFFIAFIAKVDTHPQKINLSLDDDSYYKTESGDVYKPVFEYNDIELSPDKSHQDNY